MIDQLIAIIKGKDEKARAEAWQAAASLGSHSIKPMAELMKEPDLEVVGAGQRCLWKIVHTAGRPGAENEKKAVVAELLPLLKNEGKIRHEVLWMLSELGGDESVAQIGKFLSDKDVREDARAVLQRISRESAVAALKAGLESASQDFKPAIAQALRAKGVKAQGYPSSNLIPSKQTSLKAD
jgi:HEAT repeat protein